MCKTKRCPVLLEKTVTTLHFELRKESQNITVSQFMINKLVSSDQESTYQGANPIELGGT